MIIQDRREVLERKAAWILAEAIQQAVLHRPRVVLAVPGGRSVVTVLNLLRREQVDWEKVELFMVDERLVPLNHPDSNFKLVSECLDGCLAPEHMHPFPFGNTPVSEGLRQYRETLLSLGGRFDITLLSSGEDGHIAGLFPNHETVRSNDEFFIATDSAPKPPPERVSASRCLVEASGLALLLFFGREKTSAFKAYRDPQFSVTQCPAKMIEQVPDHYVLSNVPC